jgi:hypothetical protein
MTSCISTAKMLPMDMLMTLTASLLSCGKGAEASNYIMYYAEVYWRTQTQTPYHMIDEILNLSNIKPGTHWLQ